jgi:ubiquinone biosynthesis monooxygenase Coq7
VDKPDLRSADTPGEVALKVDHAGEHGAVCIYRAQRWVARWRAPSMVSEIDDFIAHEQRHRALFAAELRRRGVRRCRSFHLCGLGGLVLGFVTGVIGARAISLTTEAVESVVLRHLEHQLATISSVDPAAAAVIRQIVSDEQEHHDRSAAKLSRPQPLDGLLAPAVRAATETVIWLGMWPKTPRR